MLNTKSGSSIFFLLLTFVLSFPAIAGTQVAQYDFNNLSGSDSYPFTNLDGQDGWTADGILWSSITPAWQMGVTNSLGFDGTHALRFQDSGGGVGASASRVNNGSFAIPSAASAPDQRGLIYTLQADFGVSYWGNVFRVAADTTPDGVIRNVSDASEVGPGITVGCNDVNVGVIIVTATGGWVRVPLSSIGGQCGQWIRFQLVIKLQSYGGQGSGSLYYQNLTNGDPQMMPVPGLQNINLALNPNASDATNPALWDALFIHFEGSTNELDNIRVARIEPANVPALGDFTLILLLTLVGISAFTVLRRNERV